MGNGSKCHNRISPVCHYGQIMAIGHTRFTACPPLSGILPMAITQYIHQCFAAELWHISKLAQNLIQRFHQIYKDKI